VSAGSLPSRIPLAMPERQVEEEADARRRGRGIDDRRRRVVAIGLMRTAVSLPCPWPSEQAASHVGLGLTLVPPLARRVFRVAANRPSADAETSPSVLTRKFLYSSLHPEPNGFDKLSPNGGNALGPPENADQRLGAGEWAARAICATESSPSRHHRAKTRRAARSI
jgi:hypothetical protein